MLADYECLNQPVVGLLKVPQHLAEADVGFRPHQGAIFEPAAHAFKTGMKVEWARLRSFGMSGASMQQLLHRSHHAMVYVPRSSESSDSYGMTFLLWGGYGANMSVLNDMWVVYIYAPGNCMGLEVDGISFWEEAWCFTAIQIHQIGDIPRGRAYAKMVALPVLSPLRSESFMICVSAIMQPTANSVHL